MAPSTVLWLAAALSARQHASGFVPPSQPAGHRAASTSPVGASASRRVRAASSVVVVRQSVDDDEDEKPENPYADPEYPDLEFVNYDDPEYSVDQGEEGYDEEMTMAEIEAMREERRRKNDEYQFETYHANVLRGGERCLGEWTVFQTDTFMGEDVVKGRHPEAQHVPRMLKWDKVLKVVSRGNKIIKDSNAEWRVDGERLVHEEQLATIDDFPSLMNVEAPELAWDGEHVDLVGSTYWPSEMESLDFRGPAGNMCVGNAYTICDATPLDGKSGDVAHEGPFSEMRTELGVQDNGMRFRIKLDYSALDGDAGSEGEVPPPLHLKTLTICRETLDGYWPSADDNEEKGREGEESEVFRKNQEEISAALFGPPGAPGGLYDPPPVGSEERAVDNYMLLDFEGGSTVLLPHRLDQNEDDGEAGWVTSLDWTPGPIRYQVDRKVMGGSKLKGLRTLELSEVQSAEADKYRPKDGGSDMRQ